MAYTLTKKKNISGALNAFYGEDGKSAYEIAVANGFEGNEAEWIESLKGEQGKQGERGNSGVYLGSGVMPDDCNVQIDPNGEYLTEEDLKTYLTEQIAGDFNTALDSIIAIQNSLIGGDAE